MIFVALGELQHSRAANTIFAIQSFSFPLYVPNESLVCFDGIRKPFASIVVLCCFLYFFVPLLLIILPFTIWCAILPFSMCNIASIDLVWVCVCVLETKVNLFLFFSEFLVWIHSKLFDVYCFDVGYEPHIFSVVSSSHCLHFGYDELRIRETRNVWCPYHRIDDMVIAQL